MKHLIYLLSSYILFTSCYSYKIINLSENKLFLTEKYKITTTQEIKGRIAKFSDSTLVLVKNEIEIEIPFSEIQEIKKRKFSYLKTAGFIIITQAIAILSCYAVGCLFP